MEGRGGDNVYHIGIIYKIRNTFIIQIRQGPAPPLSNKRNYRQTHALDTCINIINNVYYYYDVRCALVNIIILYFVYTFGALLAAAVILMFSRRLCLLVDGRQKFAAAASCTTLVLYNIAVYTSKAVFSRAWPKI